MSAGSKRRKPRKATPRGRVESNPSGFLVAEAIAMLGKLRQAWPWLSDLRTPGPARPALRPVSEREAAARAKQWADDRAAALEALKHGRVPSEPRADAARPGPIDARARIAAQLARLAARLLRFRGLSTVAMLIRPDAYTRTVPCRACRGAAVRPMPPAWPIDRVPWPPPCRYCDNDPARQPDCKHCGGVAPEPPPCRYCRGGQQTLVSYFDPTDAVVITSLDVVADVLPGVDQPDVAGDAARTLTKAVELAHRACGIAESLQRINAACPACGRHELVADTASLKPAEWSIRCEWPDCTCTGPACGCGRPVRYPRLRHRWPAKEWDGPRGLAARLGVDLPGTRRAPRKRTRRKETTEHAPAA